MQGTDFIAEVASYRTIADGLKSRANLRPDAIAVRLLRSGEANLEVSVRELEDKVQALANELQYLTTCGDRALLLFKTGPEFITAFLACQRAGLVAVPLRLPTPRESQVRISAVLADCDPSIILTQSGARDSIAAYQFARPILEIDRMPAIARDIGQDRGTELAFLQYTAGTTGTPKGVMISHENLLTNARLCVERSGATPASSTVSWLPHYHDMGLVGAILGSLLIGVEITLMAPADFLRRPLSWLEAISRYRADIVAAPNFAYDLCAQRLSGEPRPIEAGAIDLSCLRAAFVGAEPVHAATLSRFAAAAEPLGFSPQAFLPSYGLAEATLFVDGVHGSLAQIARRFAASDLAAGNVPANPRFEPQPTDRILVACGERSSPDEIDIVIVDESADTELPDGRLGVIALSGRCVTQGYWGPQPANGTAFRSTIAGRDGRRYFRTGDVGFFHDGLLFVIGRGDDLIILNGVNYYPQDIEELAARADTRFPKWRSAAFTSGLGPDKQLVIMQEAPRRGDPTHDELHFVRSIQQSLFDNLGMGGVEVLIIAPGRLPITATGKIRRSECRTIFEAGKSDSISWQARRRTGGAIVQSKATVDETSAVLHRWRDAIGRLVGRPGAEIDPTLPISAYPLDSLKLAELHTILEVQFGITRSPEDFLGARDLKSLLDADPDLNAVTAADIIQDARIADALHPSVLRELNTDFVVTGATGMLGTRIVRELLGRSRGKVYCLVREPSQRLRRALQQSDVAASIIDTRVIGVPSDLSQLHFGLDQQVYQKLAATVGTVIHCAADVDFLRPYRDLRAINVEAVRTILEFAATGIAKRVLHVSSISVLETPEKRGRSLGESEPLANPELLANGYAQSKWAADMMMLRAAERGFEVAVCRAPWLLDSPDLAQGPGDGFIRSFITSCLQLRRVPDTTMNLNLMPVDFVGRAIAAIASRDEAIKAVYHLGADRMLAVWELAGLISAFESEVVLEPLEEWSERVERKLLSDDEFPLKRYSSLFRQGDPRGSIVSRYLRGDMPTMNSRKTHDVLSAMRLGEIPSIDTMCDLIRGTAAAVRKGESATAGES
jgi:thioester reductase-like protein